MSKVPFLAVLAVLAGCSARRDERRVARNTSHFCLALHPNPAAIGQIYLLTNP